MALRLGFAASVPPTGADPDIGHIQLVDRLLDQQPAAGADLVVLAYANADRNGHQTVASYLNMRTGDGAHSFALSGQGIGTPFSALRVMDAYARTGRASRPLIGIVECSQSGAPADSAVLLGFRAGDGFGLAEPVQETGDADELAARLAAVAAAHGRPLVVLGSTVDPAVAAISGTDVLVADLGAECTGVWLELARHWQEWAGSYPAVALFDHDALTRRGYLAVLRTTPAAP